MDYYGKILIKYILLMMLSIYLPADISFIVLTSMSLLMKFLIFVIVTVMDILISYRLILHYNAYFLFLILYIIFSDTITVSMSQLPKSIAYLSRLFMFLTYILALDYFMKKYKPKIYDIDGKRLIANIIYLAITISIIANL